MYRFLEETPAVEQRGPATSTPGVLFALAR
jgi:hypothetical protein